MSCECATPFVGAPGDKWTCSACGSTWVAIRPEDSMAWTVIMKHDRRPELVWKKQK